MTNPVFGGGSAEAYTTDQSLRFNNPDGSYLSRTPGSESNRQTFTWSGWVKRGNITLGQKIFQQRADSNSSDNFSLDFRSDDTLRLLDQYGPSGTIAMLKQTTQLFRDPSAWYHIVIAVDITESAVEDKAKLYVNGERVTDWASNTNYANNTTYETSINTTTRFLLGASRPNSSSTLNSFVDGYLAEVYFIDGTALDASSFGETDAATNQWKPIDAKDDLTFGTNGFYQSYSSTVLAASFTDSVKYTVESFTSAGANTWTCPSGVTSIDVLSVAGGGGGGRNSLQGGGGGAGGLVFAENYAVTAGVVYDITIGAGGAGTTGTGTNGVNGSNSVFNVNAEGSGATITALGGGGGAGHHEGSNGGSGGGGQPGRNGGTATQGDSGGGTGFGNAGGVGYSGGSTNDQGGGGGGAGAAGTAGVTNKAGNGAVGKDYSGTFGTGVGESGFFAGGGGGGTRQNAGAIGIGGNGGGGNGQFNNEGNENGLANTGGGGGGGSANDSGGTGGSGVVVLRYYATDGTVSGHTITANGDVANATGTNLGSTYTQVDSYTSTGSDTWTCPTGITSIELLTVAGGGGGASAGRVYSGGGGGGGVVHSTAYPVTPGTVYDLTVGAGGAQNANGSDSVFNVNGEGTNTTVLTAKGGGDGGNPISGNGNGGGSGGGGAGPSGSGGSTNQTTSFGSPQVATGYGNDAQDGGGNPGTSCYGGGGGGAGGASTSWNGGIGKYFATFSGYGDSGYFGGGGATQKETDANGNFAAGVGGAGGGADGRARPGNAWGNGDPGAANTGGGGAGAAGSDSASKSGGAGGSGVILIAYEKSKPGNSSITFDGSGDYLSVASSSDFGFGAGDFTIELWFRRTAADTYPYLFDCRTGGTEGDYPAVYLASASSYAPWYHVDGVDRILSNTTTTTDTWYHFAIVRSSSTTTMYLDGSSVGTWSDSTNYATCPLRIGNYSNGSFELTGDMDEIRISDSARYTANFTPSTTEFTADSNTKLLIHSDFDGGLGQDISGNDNDFAVTNLVATDQVVDSPTNNFATLNPLGYGQHGSNYGTPSMSEGNLKATSTGASYFDDTQATISPASGKWYYEICLNQLNLDGGTGYVQFNIGGGAYIWSYYGTPTTIISGDASTTVSNFSVGDILQFAVDIDNGKAWFGNNGTWYTTSGTPDPAAGTGQAYTFTGTFDGRMARVQIRDGSGTQIVTCNFGQDSSFTGNKTAQGNQDGNNKGDFYYTPPTGFLALCTDNLPSPEIALPTDHFNTALYTGNQTARSITGIGFQPDMLWGKVRSTTGSSFVVDSVRGLGNDDSMGVLDTTDANGEYLDESEQVLSFDSDGFSLGDNDPQESFKVNRTGQTYATWNWKAGGAAASNTDGDITSSVSANTTAGFSIVSYTSPGTDSDETVGHGLSQRPDMVIIKNLDSAYNWDVWTPALSSGYDLKLNDSAAQASGRWSTTIPTASLVTLLDTYEVAGTDDYIAYCFHSVEGYSKVGSYEGNGSSTDNAFVYTGFRPAFIMQKNADAGSSWWLMYDNKRTPYNQAGTALGAQANNADTTGFNIDILSNGFKVRDAEPSLGNSNTYIYLAFAESPFKYSNAR